MSAWLALLAATGGLMVAFAAVFLLARRLDNYGVVDVAWSWAFAGLAAFYAWALPGWTQRRWVVAAMVAVWSVRLGTHLARRVARHHPAEDGRYQEMRRRWSGHFVPTMFGFFQLQAVSVVVLGLPFLLAGANPAAGFRVLEMAGAILWLTGICGEALADQQLATFKRRSPDRGEVCRFGLWRYSRHPNYFFEWLVWVGFGVFACASPWGWLGLIAPAGILYLLLRVTGVPPTEEQALRSKGDAYRRYQQTTSAFFPWRPRAATSAAGTTTALGAHPQPKTPPP